jgi:hypothetical protein
VIPNLAELAEKLGLAGLLVSIGLTALTHGAGVPRSMGYAVV